MNNLPNKALQLLEFQMMNDTLKELAPLVIERTEPLAKIRKAKFDALIKEGFTEHQAIEVVSKSPIVE